MSRGLAILLVLVFSFSLIAPALATDDSGLPECCRRGGKHHCALMDRTLMDEADAPAPGPTVKSQPSRCRFFPNGGAMLPHSDLAFAVTMQPAAVFVVTEAGVLAQVEAGYRISAHRSHQKRGPPALLS